MQRRAPMLFKRLALTAIPTCLLFACSQAAPLAPKAPTSPLPEGYVTIHPDVSVSESAKPPELEQASADPGPNADVMAEIMAIPPGR
jgi:hypothetical protein